MEPKRVMTQSLISIVMPMRNACGYAAKAIRSVLNQEAVDLELIVIDDGSTDGSADVVRRIDDNRVRLLQGCGRGAASAFNVGLAHAKGDLLARCDADDCFAPRRLLQQQQWLDRNPSFGAVCGGFAAMSQRGSFIRNFECGITACEVTDELRSGQPRTSFCTWLVRTKLVEQVGGCREYFRTGEDIDLQLRLGEVCRVWFDPTLCYSYRLHDQSTTHTVHRRSRSFYEETARRMQQQRLSGGLDDLQRGEVIAPPTEDGTPIENSRDHIQGILMGAAWNDQFAGNRGRAICTALRACMMRPTNVHAWKNLGAIAIRGS